MPDMIPTDRAAVVQELALLLEETPLTTDRGRMFHLLNALASPEPATGGGASGAGVYKLTTLSFDSSQVSPNGVVSNGSFAFDTIGTFGLTGGNFMTLSLLNADGSANEDLTNFANLFNLFGTVFSIVVTAEGGSPSQFGTVRQSANINGVRDTTFALEFFNSPFENGTSLTDGANYDIYVVPNAPFNFAGYYGTPISANPFFVDLTDNTPSRNNVFLNSSDPTVVTQIVVASSNGLVRSKLASLANRTLIFISSGQESTYSVSAVDSSDSERITLTVSNLEDGVSNFNDNETIYLAAF